MINIDDLNVLVTGSNDTQIRLYECKGGLSAKHKELKGHIKGIKCLAYIEEYKYLVSCSFDFDVLVWNIYLDHPVSKL